MREVLTLARAEAERLGQDFIAPEHLLLGVLHKGDGLALRALEATGLEVAALREALEQRLPAIVVKPNQVAYLTRTYGKLLTPNNAARSVLNEAQDLARQLHHNWIGTEHLLLAVIAHASNGAADVLVELGVDLPALKADVLQAFIGKTEIRKEPTGSDHAPAPRNTTKIQTALLRGLMTILHDAGSPAMDALRAAGTDFAKLEVEVQRRLAEFDTQG